MAGIPDMVKLVVDLATYEAAVAAGKTSPDVMYLIIAEKKVYFQGEDWTANSGGAADTSDLATKEELIEVEHVVATVLNDHEERLATLTDEYTPLSTFNETVENTRAKLFEEIINIEYVTATALCDLNTRLGNIEESQL